MKILVEVGDPEQKAIIEDELSSLGPIAALLNSSVSLSQIIVASDFDRTVNELQRANSYKSIRKKHSVAAKVLQVNNEAIMVLSPRLYTAEEDFQSRMLTYFHELIHLHNWQLFPTFCDWYSIPIYYSKNLYILFDEYYADRKALEITDQLFKKKTEIYTESVEKAFNGHMQIIMEDCESYNILKREIYSFRQHCDVTRFLNATYETFDGLSKAIIHAYAYLDHLPKFTKRANELQSSMFVNNNTISLIEYIRSKYFQNSFDLANGVSLIESFLANFGVRFEIQSSGRTYCHVLDV